MAKENEFYMQLINLALPPETNNHTEAAERPPRGTALLCFQRRILQSFLMAVFSFCIAKKKQT